MCFFWLRSARLDSNVVRVLQGCFGCASEVARSEFDGRDCFCDLRCDLLSSRQEAGLGSFSFTLLSPRTVNSKSRIAPFVTAESRVMSPQDYIRLWPPVEKKGLLMRSISNKIEHYRDIAHVFSTYEMRDKADDAQAFQRGIASFQLFNDGKRWYVITMLWEGETRENP